MAEWGLSSSVKARGEAMVFGVGNFRVGEKKTKRFRPTLLKNVHYIREVDTPWLMRQWGSLLRRVDRQLDMV